MEILGSFNFGRLLKTLLPGFLNLIIICVCVDLASYLIWGILPLYDWATSKQLIFVTLFLPASIISGVFANVLFFVFFKKYLIEKYHSENESVFYKNQKAIYKCINKEISTKFTDEDQGKIPVDEYINSTAFFLSRIGVSQVEYIKKNFWDYVEFQINMIFSLFMTLPMIIMSAIVVSKKYNIDDLIIIIIIGIILVIEFLLGCLLLYAARKNYALYKRKYLSLIMGSCDMKSVSGQ